MPVPKRKVSKSRRDKRSTNKGIDPQSFILCSNCKAPNLPHSVCEKCGFYKGVKILKTKMDRILERSQKAKEQKPEEEVQ